MLPLILTAPLGAITLWFDVSGKSRRVAPEMAGVVTLASSAAVCGLAAGWSVAASVADRLLSCSGSSRRCCIFASGSSWRKGSRIRLRCRSRLHVFAVAAVAILAWYGLSPWLPVAVFTFLMVRALTGSSDFRLKLKAKQLGMLEVVLARSSCCR